MFQVIFEVVPHESQWDNYLAIAKALKSELQNTRGFLENVRYKSMTRPGWLLSVSEYEDEKALIRWRTHQKHHYAQEAGRGRVFRDYHLRIGQVFDDSRDPANSGPQQEAMRHDVTEVGQAKVVTLVNKAAEKGIDCDTVSKVVALFGFDPNLEQKGLIAWDVFEAILTPGSFMLLCSFETQADAASNSPSRDSEAERVRQVKIVRDYGMFDRREAPQYYPEKEISTEQTG